MGKFKLIKEYPGSPKIGEVWDINKFCSKFWPYDYPEFWEEIVEKDYEILMYRSKNNSCIYFDNPKYFSSLNSDWEIYSVRRKSDGVEFKIGDKVCWKWAFAKNKYFTIKSFNIIENKLRFNTVEESGQNFIFELISKEYNLQHYKEPILTTEDGYECTLDDRVFGVLPKGVWETKFWDGQGIPVNKLFNLDGKRYSEGSPWLYFKTKENAEKYIYENKPEFSRKQIRSAVSISDIYFHPNGRSYIEWESLKDNLKL